MLTKDENYSITLRLKEYGFGSLKEYYQSIRWHRMKVSKRSKRSCCSACSGRQSLELHHVTYERLCNERLDDLCWLCGQCHEIIHGIASKKGWDVRRATAFWSETFRRPEPASYVPKKKASHAQKRPSERDMGSKKYAAPMQVKTVPMGRFLKG